MAAMYNPFVYWGQNKAKIFLKVDLKEVSDPQIDLDEDKLILKAHGNGIRGVSNYGLNVEFYLPIDAERSKYKVCGMFIEFEIQKVGVGEIWPRLMVSQKKPAWLKIDFDHFAFDDSEEEKEDEKLTAADEKRWMDDFEKQMMEAEETAFADLKSFYLFIYNMFMWVGYSYVFIAMVIRYIRDGEASKQTTYDAVGGQLMVCQLAAVMEIVHPLVGFVKTSPVMPGIQVGGRNLILFVLINQTPAIQTHHAVWWLFITWSAVELIRYPFYMLSSINREIKFITWLRYTVWIPLYPMGFIFEGFVMLLALPKFEESEQFSVALPNWFNWSFHFPTFLQIYMLLYLPGMYLLMTRMYEQRKKKIPASKPFRKPKVFKTKVKAS